MSHIHLEMNQIILSAILALVVPVATAGIAIATISNDVLALGTAQEKNFGQCQQDKNTQACQSNKDKFTGSG